MARPPLPLGSWGRIARTRLGPNRWEATCRYRDMDGHTRVVRKRTPTHSKDRQGAVAERVLIESLTDRSYMSGSTITPESTILELAVAQASEWDGLAERTVDQYRARAKIVTDAIGGQRLRELQVSTLERLLGVVAESRGATTAVHVRSRLSQMLDYAVRHDAIEYNPVRSLTVATVERADSRALTRAEWGKLLEGLRTSTVPCPKLHTKQGKHTPTVAEFVDRIDLLDVVLVMGGTGMRIGETLALRWQDVDLEARTITVAGHLTFEKGKGTIWEAGTKGGPTRLIGGSEFAFDAIAARRRGGGEDPVFPGARVRWRRPSGAGEGIVQAATALGPELGWVTSHTFRRSVATWLDEAGVSARVIADQLGHKQISMTQDKYLGRGRTHSEVGVALGRVLG